MNIPFLTVMGLPPAGPSSARCVATTLVPALLGFMGTRTSQSVGQAKIAKAESPVSYPCPRRYVGLLKRAPVIVTVVGVIVLLFVAAPFMHMRLGLPDAGSQPTSETTGAPTT